MEVPEGRLKMVAFVSAMAVSAVPPGLKKGAVLFPPLKRWAIISRPSGTSATGTSEDMAHSRLILVFGLATGILFLIACELYAETAQDEETPKVKTRVNISLPTLGGKQYWQDVYIYGGWRIQRNVFTKHHRLLGPKDFRQAWGSREQCEYVLEKAKAEEKAVIVSDDVCLLLHGLGRSKDSMKRMKRSLIKAGYEVYDVNYASLSYKMERLSEQLREILTSMQGDFKEINVVTHSMGGIIARDVLSKNEFENMGRLVMLAPPNQGAKMADWLLGKAPLRYFTGPSGKQLRTDAESFARKAGVPKCEFGVIAGQRKGGKGFNPFISEPDDGLVGVEETKMDGMKDFVVVRATHAFIMSKKETIRQTINFIENGEFDHGDSEDELPDNHDRAANSGG